jgi:hypothetical protein
MVGLGGGPCCGKREKVTLGGTSFLRFALFAPNKKTKKPKVPGNVTTKQY